MDYIFGDMMVTVVCSNFYHFGKQVGVNSEKTFKGIIFMKLICQTSSLGVISLLRIPKYFCGYCDLGWASAEGNI